MIGWLTLSRKWREDIVIETPAGLMTVRVADIGLGRVKLAFQAPPDFKILRKEVRDRILEDNAATVGGEG